MSELRQFDRCVLFIIAITPGNLAAQTAASHAAVSEVRVDGSRHELERIAGVTPAPDLSIAVRQSMTPVVTRFAAGGSPMPNLGRQGEGPGETKSPSFVGWLGDAWAVGDGGQRRTVHFSPEGAHRKTTRWPTTVERIGGPAATPGTERFFVLYAMQQRGGYIANMTGTEFPHGGTAVVSPTGRIEQVLFRFHRADPCVSGVRTAKVTVSTPQPPCRARAVRVADNGELAVLLQDAHDRPGPPLLDVILVAATGDTVYSQRLSYDRRAISRADRNEIADRLAVYRERIRQMVDVDVPTVPVPSHYPAVEHVVLARDGQVWLRRWDGNPMREWWRLNRAGMRDAIVHLPAGVRIVAALGDRVWYTELDQDDVPSIVRARVVSVQ